LYADSFLIASPGFLRSSFEGQRDDLCFIDGLPSATSRMQMKAASDRRIRECARRDARLAFEAKNGFSALVTMRQWGSLEFTRLRRKR
jgi:hypothetical protein